MTEELYQRALARALGCQELDADIAGEPMMAAVAHAQRVAAMAAEIERLTSECEQLRAAIRHVLQRCNDNGGEIDAELVAELRAALGEDD
jgi:hypothetical protein